MRLPCLSCLSLIIMAHRHDPPANQLLVRGHPEAATV
jgi:hypothetical protein